MERPAIIAVAVSVIAAALIAVGLFAFGPLSPGGALEQDDELFELPQEAATGTSLSIVPWGSELEVDPEPEPEPAPTEQSEPQPEPEPEKPQMPEMPYEEGFIWVYDIERLTAAIGKDAGQPLADTLEFAMRKLGVGFDTAAAWVDELSIEKTGGKTAFDIYADGIRVRCLWDVAKGEYTFTVK